MKCINIRKPLLFLITQLFAVCALAIPNAMTLQTKILKPDGVALSAASVNFQVTTLDALGTCVLYVETFAGVNMTSSGGVVVTNLGTGAQVYSATGSTYGTIYNNETPAYNCQAGGTYNPALTDRRKIVLQFNDGTAAGWQTTQAVDVNSVPFSNYAGDSIKLSGHLLADFPLKASIPDCSTTSKVLTFNGVAFTCVANGAGAGTVTNVTSANAYISVATGTTTPLITANVGTVANTLAAGNDARIIGAAQKANNLSDLASATMARTNLGLGAAATMAVGTASGTVAAGDDARIVGALPTASYTADMANVLESNCAAGSAPKWNTVADAWTCVAIGSLPASAISSGTVGSARLGTGTADATTYLRGDGTWTAPPGSQWTTTGSDIYYNTGKVGIGTTTPGAPLQVDNTVTANSGGFRYGTLSNSTVSPTVSGSGSYVGAKYNTSYNATAGNDTSGLILGVWSDVQVPGSAHPSSVYGGFFSANIGTSGTTTTSIYGVTGWASSSAGTQNSIIGGNFQSFINSTTVANTYGIKSNVDSSSAGGNATSAYGVFSDVTRSTGTITNAYGVYTGTVQGTNKYSIYASDATAPSYFAGNVQVGGTIKIAGGTPGAGKVLTSDATGLASWQAAGGSGTVTNVTSANSYLSVATGTTTPALTLNVGTAANTVAAGDDSRITDAAQKANNLSDLASATTARTNLGLTSTATMAVGTTAGTVAAGDDSRISGAVQQTAYNGDIANVLDSNCGIGSTPKWNVVGDMWTCVAIGSLPASAITTGTVASARLGSGTADNTTFLRGDGTWATPAGGGSSQWTTTGSNIYYNTGKVGIGTTGPTAPLDVVSGSYGTVIRAKGNTASAFTVDTGDASFGAQTIITLPANISGADSSVRLNAEDNTFLISGNSKTALRFNLSTGNIGLGGPEGTDKLEVTGNMHSTGQAYTNQKVLATGATVDFNDGNVQVLQSVGGSAITLNNMKDGASYVLIINDATARTYTFTNCTQSKFAPLNADTTASTTSIYNIIKVTLAATTYCYISWSSGYQ